MPMKELMKTTLTISRGAQAGFTLELINFPITIGKNIQNSFPVTDPNISDYHLSIKKRGRLFIIENLAHACYVNGERIKNSILKSGDKILVGDTEFIFNSPHDLDIHDLVTFEEKHDKIIKLSSPDQAEFDPHKDRITLMSTHDRTKLINPKWNLKKIFDFHSNIMIADDIKEIAQTLLKSIYQIMPNIEKALFFVSSKPANKLIPIASKMADKNSKLLYISYNAINEVIAHKKSALITYPHNKHIPLRLIIPMLRHDEVIALIHLESGIHDIPRDQIDLVHELIQQSGASFENILLRKELEGSMLGFVETILATIEAKDTYTLGHSERVCKYSMAIAEELKLDRETKRILMISSLCHDIGKIGIADTILKKASFLNHEEYEEMKLHPIIGGNIFLHMPNAQKFIGGIKYHHEKWDGTGYPEGLTGEKIPFFGRIVAVADVFDAMTSGRSYSGFIDESDAMDKLSLEAELFDPEILKALISAWDSGRITQKTSTISRKKNKS